MDAARRNSLTTTDILRQYNNALNKLGTEINASKTLKTQTSNETVLNESVTAEDEQDNFSRNNTSQNPQQDYSQDKDDDRVLSPTPTPISLSMLAQKHQQAIMLETPTLRYTSKNYFANIQPPPTTSLATLPPTANATPVPKSPYSALSPRISSAVPRALSSAAGSVVVKSPVPVAEPEIAPAAENEVITSFNKINLDDVPLETKIADYLSQLDNGPEILLGKLKANSNTVNEVVQFFKRRAVMETDYGKAGIKLYEKSATFELVPHRQGTFGDGWRESLNLHMSTAQEHLKLAAELRNLADELGAEFKQLEKDRKQAKETFNKYTKVVVDARQRLEKAKVKYDAASEEWERAQECLTADPSSASSSSTSASRVSTDHGSSTLKRGRSSAAMWAKRASSKLTIRLNNIVRDAATPSRSGDYKAYAAAAAANGYSANDANYQKLQKWEDEARKKLAHTNDRFRVQLELFNECQNAFRTEQVPRLVRHLFDFAAASDSVLADFLARYAAAVERAAVQNAANVCPLEASGNFGLVKIYELIRNQQDLLHFVNTYVPKSGSKALDWSTYLQNEQIALQESPKYPVFGVSLETHLAQYGVPVPIVVSECCKIIEEFGSTKNGIYRFGGNINKAMELKALFQKDALNVRLRSEEHAANIHDIAELLKLYFRELPDFLFTQSAYLEFIEAAKISDERLRLVTIHELVNRLPDPNYATLKYLMTHLNRIQASQQYNKMTVQALAVSWAPILLGGGDQSDLDHDTSLQCQVIQVILGNFYALFDSDY